MKTPPGAPFCFHPTSAVFIDDDRQFLKSYSMVLTANQIPHKMFDKPIEATEYLDKMYQQKYWLRDCTTENETDEESNIVESNVIKLYVSKLKDKVFDPDRFNEVSCVFIDQKMPEQTGIECIETLQKLPLRKGMLSGIVDHSEAIEHFNDQVFDMFVNKLDPEAPETVVKNLKRAQYIYFNEVTAQLVKDNAKLRNILLDKSFVNFLNNFVKENNICEGYLLDDFASYLLLDKEAHAKILAMVHGDEIEAYYEMAKMADTKPSNDVLEKLKSKQFFPFFYDVDTSNLEPKEWEKYLVPAKQIPNSNIYYHIIDNVNKYGFDLSKVKSFQQYLDEQKTVAF